jgi:hypothetical protein
MDKTIYLVRAPQTENYRDFRKRVFKIANQILASSKPKELKVVLTEKAAPALSIIPFKNKKVATISAKYDYAEEAVKLDQGKDTTGTYQVSEVLPVAYNKHWEDGEATPGICLLTLFNKNKNIEYDRFLDIWHNSHTPLSLKIHPLWNYNRNVVENRGDDNLENWDGIVEEHFKEKSDLLNPFKFFGNPLKIVPNMIAVYRDTKSFLDYASIEPYLAMEYYLKS